ncbi:MAG: hypothetical protein AAGG08_14575, partial [Actinomycetota bacterium]
TRTLLLLSVGTALAILLAGGVLLFQLSSQEQASEPLVTGRAASVGDLEVTVLGASESDGRFEIDVVVSGVDDDLSGIGLTTAQRSLAPIEAPADGRCTTLTVAEQRCALAFDTSADTSTSRVLVIRRGDEQRTWSPD